MKTKLIPAGKLKNLNDFVVGASVLTSGNLVGYIYKTSKTVTRGLGGEVCEIQADIKYPMHGSSYHTYRHDGRSQYDAKSDIVNVCNPINSKVKAIKVWSNQNLDPELIEKGNEIGLVYKLYIDTEKKGKNWTGNKTPRDLDGIGYKCQLGKSGILSVKVWRV